MPWPVHVSSFEFTREMPNATNRILRKKCWCSNILQKITGTRIHKSLGGITQFGYRERDAVRSESNAPRAHDSSKPRAGPRATRWMAQHVRATRGPGSPRGCTIHNACDRLGPDLRAERCAWRACGAPPAASIIACAHAAAARTHPVVCPEPFLEPLCVGDGTIGPNRLDAGMRTRHGWCRQPTESRASIPRGG